MATHECSHRIGCPRIFRRRSWSPQRWSCSRHRMVSRFTGSCLKQQAAPRRSRRLFSCTVAHRGRCCSAGTTYALNQYLASRGYVVLSVNYRLGIGYGHDFHRPPHAGAQGASEYQDVKAGAEYLQGLPQVDPKRVGIYGGSYGGYLTALALARDSSLFAAGVDIHGVHNWTAERAAGLLENRYEKPPDVQRALDVAWESSPISSVDKWKSPVLLAPSPK